MNESEPRPAPPPAPATPAAPAAAARPAAPAAPPRPLPNEDDIAAFVEGEDRPIVGALLEGVNVARLDILVMQIRKEELLPQHWQVLTGVRPTDDASFDALPEVARLRVRYRDQELARQRLDALRAGWRELRGKRPALWTVPDLFAALRRLLGPAAAGTKTDLYQLLCAIRDVWRDSTLPHGREQLELLWACLAQIRKLTKK